VRVAEADFAQEIRMAPGSVTATFLIALTTLSLAAGVAESAERCSARIEVELDASVSNPRDPSFLSALTANAQYQLIWLEGDGTRAVYQLTGPATDHRCEEQVNRMRRNANVTDLRVVEAGIKDD
jgi:hypothetical protein